MEADPGCKDFYPCCERFEGEDEGGCTVEGSDGCKVYCPWCDKDPSDEEFKEGCRGICSTCGGQWGVDKGCTELQEMEKHKEVVLSTMTIRKKTLKDGGTLSAFAAVGVKLSNNCPTTLSNEDPNGFINRYPEVVDN